ncbi:MAG: FAD-binding oxidoreductase [Candidatus Aenigmarchaeota archaeon]|nr:FAD-binding oxidoreductase [Candidatus Aenigmarchaeota archaeon]
MKIAVVGGGIFGVTAAVKLAGAGHSVDLFEKGADIMGAASGLNQFRLHRGYHYPRSDDTVASLLEAEPEFKKEYPEAVVEGVEQYYCIAKGKTLTTAEQYAAFLKKHGLHAEEVSLDLINKDKIALTIKVKENLIDPHALKEACWRKLRAASVRVRLNTEAKSDITKDYDFVVVATYAAMNAFFHEPAQHKKYQFELCEKPVVRLPQTFNNKSIVVMDGPFMCVDPYGRTGNFLLGNVVHAIHQSNVGKHPIIDEEFRPLLHNGVIKNLPITNFDKFIESAAEFIPAIREAEHVGSFFTIRTVLPYLESTDARPTVVQRVDDKIITMFSGKIPNCVNAANEVVRIIGNEVRITSK